MYKKILYRLITHSHVQLGRPKCEYCASLLSGISNRRKAHHHPLYSLHNAHSYPFQKKKHLKNTAKHCIICLQMSTRWTLILLKSFFWRVWTFFCSPFLCLARKFHRFYECFHGAAVNYEGWALTWALLGPPVASLRKAVIYHMQV